MLLHAAFVTHRTPALSTNALVLQVLDDGLESLHVPYSYGFAIILLTILVKIATFPLSQKQVCSANAHSNMGDSHSN